MPPIKTLTNEVDDEEAEGVWGYLVPIDNVFGDTLVLRHRIVCPAPDPDDDFGKATKNRAKHGGQTDLGQEEDRYEKGKVIHGFPAGGYLIGRHPECGKQPPAMEEWHANYSLKTGGSIYRPSRTDTV